jgi:hypothetical protein
MEIRPILDELSRMVQGEDVDVNVVCEAVDAALAALAAMLSTPGKHYAEADKYILRIEKELGEHAERFKFSPNRNAAFVEKYRKEHIAELIRCITERFAPLRTGWAGAAQKIFAFSSISRQLAQADSTEASTQSGGHGNRCLLAAMPSITFMSRHYSRRCTNRDPQPHANAEADLQKEFVSFFQW